MRHRKSLSILSRKKSAREALLRSLAIEAILKGRIKTTEAKAKVVRPLLEKLITRGRKPSLNTQRYLTRLLTHTAAVRTLLNKLGPRYQTRRGGYTRITKLNRRMGDGGQEAMLELIE